MSVESYTFACALASSAAVFLILYSSFIVGLVSYGRCMGVFFSSSKGVKEVHTRKCLVLNY